MGEDVGLSSRREFIAGGVLAGAVSVTLATGAAAAASQTPSNRESSRSVVRASDGTGIYVKDWGHGPAIVLCHGWPLTADAWDSQALYLVNAGFRVVAHDRRSHGRSEQVAIGNDMDTYADDLARVLDVLDIKAATLVGHSTGGGEVARYISRHGRSRVSKAVLVSSVPPHMAQSPSNPNGAPMSVFDGLRSGMSADRSQFFKDLALPFFGFNREGAKPIQGAVDSFWLQGMNGGIKGQYDCIKAFSETDFTDDLRKMQMSTLVIHGSDDQIVPFSLASERSMKLLPSASLKIYPNAPHGLPVTHASQLNTDLAEFARS